MHTNSDICGVLLPSRKAFKKHRRKVHNFRRYGPQGQPRRPRKDSISISSISISSGESSLYIPYKPRLPASSRNAESDDDGSEIERRSNSRSISRYSHSSVHARRRLDFFTRLTREQPSIETECDICGILLPSRKALKSHRRKVHNFRGYGP
jgi:uncharacterized C2H2 Zn-finger protein